MRHLATTMVIVAAAGGAVAQQPARTVQQDFDAATALSQGTDPAVALAAWDAVGRRVARNARSTAVVQVRRAHQLWRLGRNDEALAAAEAGLARLPATDATLAADRYDGLLTVGRTDYAILDYAGAATAFTAAEAIGDSAETKLVALLGLIEVQTFVDPVAARAAMTRADALISTTKLDPISASMFARRRALLALNTADLATAKVESQKAVKLLGGLTARSDVRDISARGDAALALILGGSADQAREYLAFTGAGRLPQTTFDPARNMVVPDCGGENGLKPADLAVVEFTIGDDGAVSISNPVYAAGGPQVGLEFARVVRGWSWTPEQVKELPPFYRQAVRVEMRCSTGFERPSVETMLAASLDEWLEDKGLTPPERPANDATAVVSQRGALAAAEARGGRDAPALLPPLLALQRNAVVGREETHDLAARSVAIARAAGAPPGALLALVVTERTTATKSGSPRDSERALAPLLTDPVFAADPATRSAVRLMLADLRKGAGGTDLLRQVADDPALKADDPAKVGALVRLASREQTDGDAAAARAAFERAGVDAGQCALLDSPPRLTGYNGTFPNEAVRWGFEGWTQTQFDVDAAGRVANERAILSYPAFVFSQAGTNMMRNARFTKSYRPDGKLGCGSLVQRVRFSMR